MWPLELSLPHIYSLIAPLRSSICPCSSSCLGWCCHSAIILFFLCFLRFLSSVFEAGEDTRVLIFSCCTKQACKKLLPSRTCSLFSPVARKDLRTKNSACPAPMLNSVLDNQKQIVTVVQNSAKVGWRESAGSMGIEAAECFRIPCNLAEPEYAFPVGESDSCGVT